MLFTYYLIIESATHVQSTVREAGTCGWPINALASYLSSLKQCLIIAVVNTCLAPCCLGGDDLGLHEVAAQPRARCAKCILARSACAVPHSHAGAHLRHICWQQL